LRSDADVAAVPIEETSDALKAQIVNKTCIDIVGITKKFETPTGTKTAVDTLNLTFYNGQITALLGHNGAGKTTLIGMLTGLMPPTSGTALVEGMDLRYEMGEIRKNMGVCPQHDIHFPDLTVEEHLSLFASFKGMAKKDIPAEVTKMIESVGLVEKRKVYSRQLSGGQKRKLSVGIAFIGGSRIVFLDEPTSGMDPYSRRFTWNVIRQYKENRVIVLTTHFMDEADLLGDRIAIMGDGKLCCSGSSLFLKKNFGVGYNLVIEKLSAQGKGTGQIKEVIENYVPEATMLTDVGTEVTFQLPLSASEKFPSLFEEVDNNLEALGVRSYGMSVTTLEEVFIKIAHGTTTNATADAGRQAVTELKRKRSVSGSNHERNSSGMEMVAVNDSNRADAEAVSAAVTSSPPWDGQGYNLHAKALAGEREFQIVSADETMLMFVKHIHACVFKRFLYFKRDIKSFIFLYAIPIIFILIGALVVALVSSTVHYKDLTLTGHVYNPAISTAYLPTPYSNSTQYCQQSDAATVTGCTGVGGTPSHYIDSLSVASQLPTVGLDNVSSIYSMSQYLYSNMDTRAASTIGAITYTSLESIGSGALFRMEYILHANFTALHSSPLYQSWLINGLLASYDPAVTVTTSLHPLPQTHFENSFSDATNVDLIATFVLLSIPFVAANFATFIVREREVKAKHQQLVSGVSIVAFWISCWIWDFISYQPTLWSFIIIISACPGTEALAGVTSGALGCTIGLLILFGTSISSFAYLISMLFSTPAMTQIVVIFTMFILGLILGIVGVVLRFILGHHNLFVRVVRYVLALIPPYALADGLHSLCYIDIWSSFELGGGLSYKPSDWRIAGLPLAYLAAESVFFLVLVIAIEYVRLIPSVSSYFNSAATLPVDNTPKDEDVVAEELAVAAEDPNTTSHRVLIKDCKKMYPGGKYAVRGVSLGIPNGQCFGLLGINGAGKTTLLSMLSGEVVPSAGELFLDRRNLSTDVHNCRRLIGFCPQFDALFELMTGREHLQLYARIKGIVEAEVDAAVNAKIAEMGLTEYADRQAGTYSGGNKRKLSVAIAMIGDPSIVFLDEPSTGMDPVARRFMWEVISDVVCRREKCSVILTTHSMEECEALCTRIGIMVGGILRCLGSSQRLRSRFGHGIQIEIGMVIPNAEAQSVKCADLFAALQPAPNGVTDVEACAVNQQQVFALFAAKGVPDWARRFNTSGSGSDLATTLEAMGSISLKQLAGTHVCQISVCY
jgi:ATP-binding cassette subfamily A (ABC1) protein 3